MLLAGTPGIVWRTGTNITTVILIYFIEHNINHTHLFFPIFPGFFFFILQWEKEESRDFSLSFSSKALLFLY